MQSLEIKAFKNELRNYNYLCSRIVSLENSIEFCYDRLGGVRGVDPSKEPVHAMPNKELEYKLRDDISKFEALLAQKVAQKVEIDRTLDRMENDVREAVFKVYAMGYSCVKVADEYFLSSTGLQKRMNKAIKEALREI